MAKDQRLFVKFTLDFADHEKILPLSDAAFRCLIEATIWSAKRKSDGWLARRLALAKWSLDVLHELSTNDPENPSLIESEDGWQIHDYAEIQQTRAEIEAQRERCRIAGQKGGLARGKRVAKQSAKRVAKQSAKRNSSETVAEVEVDNSLSTDVLRESARKRGTRLDPHWMPPQTVIDTMKRECPNVDLQAEHRKFVDYWTDKAGVAATKVSWEGTWRNWIRRASQQAPQQRAPDGTSVVDAKVNDWLALANQPTLKAIGE